MCHHTHRKTELLPGCPDIKRMEPANSQRVQDQIQQTSVLPPSTRPQPQRWSYPGIYPGAPPLPPAWQPSWQQQPYPAYWPAMPQPTVAKLSRRDRVLAGFIGGIFGALSCALFLFVTPLC
jgi:hypothetical protein